MNISVDVRAKEIALSSTVWKRDIWARNRDSDRLHLVSEQRNRGATKKWQTHNRHLLHTGPPGRA